MPLPFEGADRLLLAEGEYQGMPWVVLHNGLGFRCGYVGIPEGHPWFDVEYDDLPVRCHGGLSYGTTEAREATAWFRARPRESGVYEGRSWIGFDCGHAWDAADPALLFIENGDPRVQAAMMRMAAIGETTIRTTEYVEAQCRSIIDQAILARIALPAGLWPGTG